MKQLITLSFFGSYAILFACFIYYEAPTAFFGFMILAAIHLTWKEWMLHHKVTTQAAFPFQGNITKKSKHLIVCVEYILIAIPCCLLAVDSDIGDAFYMTEVAIYIAFLVIHPQYLCLVINQKGIEQVGFKEWEITWDKIRKIKIKAQEVDFYYGAFYEVRTIKLDTFDEQHIVKIKQLIEKKAEELDLLMKEEEEVGAKVGE